MRIEIVKGFFPKELIQYIESITYGEFTKDFAQEIEKKGINTINKKLRKFGFFIVNDPLTC